MERCKEVIICVVLGISLAAAGVVVLSMVLGSSTARDARVLSSTEFQGMISKEIRLETALHSRSPSAIVGRK